MMKKQNWILISIFILLILTVAVMAGLNLLRKYSLERAEEMRRTYKLGEVCIDKNKGIIWFDAVVTKNQGPVQFLLYLQGYKWLKDDCALVSQSRLKDLQEALALLDWKTWDDIWNRKRNQQTQKHRMEIVWIEEGQIKRIKADDLVDVKEIDKPLFLWDFVFLGSPYFDRVALEAPSSLSCESCPVFALEEKALRQEFVRKSQESGYKLKPDILPKEERKVRVEITAQ